MINIATLTKLFKMTVTLQTVGIAINILSYTLRPQNNSRDMEGHSRQLPELARNLLPFQILVGKGRIWKERDRQGPPASLCWGSAQ
jgi:hypothetical protein